MYERNNKIKKCENILDIIPIFLYNENIGTINRG